MKTRIALSLVLAGLALAALAVDARAGTRSDPIPPTADGAPRVPPRGVNPFGLMIAAQGISTERAVELARDFGVTAYRPSKAIIVESWRGQCAECATARRAGLELILSVRASGGPGIPSAPPADLEKYRERLGEILDQTQPAILTVENEENSELFYTGTPEEYGSQLQAACEVAHARGIQCTNGGLVSSLVALLTWEDILAQGDAAGACDFAWRAFAGQGEPVPPEVLCRARSAADLPPLVQAKIAKGHALLDVYQTVEIDALNFHWYVADAEAMRQAVEFLRDGSDLPILSNEVGQHDEDPATPPAVLSEALGVDLSCAVWFSIDISQARALINPDGSLRPNGLAFRDFMAAYAGQH